MKIIFVTESLVPIGGTEKILTEKANYLADNFNYNVTIITCTQHNNQPNAFPLSKTVNQINLCVQYYRQYLYGYPKRLWIKRETDKELKRKITNTILELKPDYVISTVGFRADIVSTINCNAIKIIECHEARYFVKADMDRSRSFFSHIYMKLYQRSHYLRTVEKNADVVVTLTEGDKQLWKKAKHVEVIPNFSTMHVSQYSDYKSKQIIAVGRLSPEKGYERLLEIWRMIWHKYPDWSLTIFGDGKMRDELNMVIRETGLNNICIHNATLDISKEYAKSSIFVMTSHLEGFGLALLEALKHGIPCIAFDCPFGPSSIIKDNYCGYLIEDGNIPRFAERLSSLMESEDTRKVFSSAAIDCAKDYSVESVMNCWKRLFENIITV